MKFLRFDAGEWTAIGVLVMAAAFGSQWLAARDARARDDGAVERKLDALFTWADLVSQLNGWPRPRIPERPVALPKLAPESPRGPYAAVLDVPQGDCP